MSTTTAEHTAETFAHPALFYRGDDEYLAGTVPFIVDGLSAGEPVAVAVPADRLAVLHSELGHDAEQVHLVDMVEAGRNPGRIIPSVLWHFADQHPDRHVRIVGEPIWPQRRAEEYPACVQHEALVNHAFSGRPVTVLCPYDADQLDDTVLTDAARTHPVLLDRSGVQESGRFEPDVVLADCNAPLAPLAGASTFVVPGPAGLPGLRRVVSAFGTRQGLDEDRADDLVLVITELATNSIEHAHSPATVLLGGNRRQIMCQVRDTGHISDPLAGRRPAAADQVRGRGLLMVNELADLVLTHTEPGATTTEVHFLH